jgi:transcriptional regulator with XRE-family HTH domain
MRVKDLIRVARKKQGLSQSELADRMRVSQQIISDWERGSVLPQPKHVPMLASALGVERVDLLTRLADNAFAVIEAKSRELSQVERRLDRFAETLDHYGRMLSQLVESQERLEDFFKRFDESEPPGRSPVGGRRRPAGS